MDTFFIALIVIAVVVYFLRWIGAALVALIVMISTGFFAGLIAGLITYCLLEKEPKKDNDQTPKG